MVVIGINHRQTKRLCVTDALFLADVVLFLWEDVGITEVQRGMYVVLHHPFNDGRRTRSAARVQQYFTCTLGDLYLIFLVHGSEGEEKRQDEDHDQAHEQLHRTTDLHVIHERVLSGRHDQRIGRR